MAAPQLGQRLLVREMRQRRPWSRWGLILVLLSGPVVAAPAPTPPGVAPRITPMAPPKPPPPIPAEQPGAVSAGEPAAKPARKEPNQASGASEDDFGRWERSSAACEIQEFSPEDRLLLETACRGVRLDQQGPGQLSIRLLPAADGSTATRRQLILAGVLIPGSQPMRCRDTRCQPQWPLRVQISALASLGLDRGGWPTTLPRARLVQGDCQIDEEGLACQAQEPEQRWLVKLRW